jgi:glycine betaine/proline transport system ATP-binding protein
MAPKLSVKNVYKVFGKDPQDALDRLKAGQSKESIFQETGQTVGVQDASFDVEEGQIFVVMGLSGSGKSTLVRMLNGLIKPTSGAIEIDGEDIASCTPEVLRRVRRNTIAMVFQHFALFPHRSIVDNAAYGLKVKGVDKDERRKTALAALEQVGLASWADSLPADLSGGMQQRVGLARALATDPQILLMDEPFGALDPLIRKEMQDELITLQKTLKKTIVFITHDLNEALVLGDRIAIMKDGRFVQTGTALEIVSAPADDYVSAFVADIDRGKVFTAQSVAHDPETVALGSSSADAIRDMEDNNRSALYVLDGESIAGVVTYQDLTAADRASDGDPVIADVMKTDFPTTDRDASLVDLYGRASAGLPIAVTDDEDRLVGVVEPEAVFAQLSGDAEAGTVDPSSDSDPSEPTPLPAAPGALQGESGTAPR